MSILWPAFPLATAFPATTPTAARGPAVITMTEVVVYMLTALAVVLVFRWRVFRAASVLGPPRVPWEDRIWIVLIAGVVGFCAWQMAGGVYVAKRLVEWKAAGIAEPDIKALLTPKDFAVLSTVPPIAGFAAMIACGLVFGRGALAALGFTPKQFPRGFGLGVTAFLIVGPLLIWTLQLVDWVYRSVHYEHDKQHVLLKSLGEAKPGGSALALVLGATIVAPLLEELLFRGHVQTFLREMFARWSAPPEPALAAAWFPGVPPPPPEAGDRSVIPLPVPPQVITYSSPPMIQVVVPCVRPWHAWLAIVITSLAFAMLHDAWMRPPIFVLSLGLGYVYERTGNLWASITVHMLFNALNTLQFVLLIKGH